jgi:hypothetical protein
MLKTSLSGVGASPANTSGAMNRGVPPTPAALATGLATPKSTSTTRPLPSTRLLGLMSAWTICWSCR